MLPLLVYLPGVVAFGSLNKLLNHQNVRGRELQRRLFGIFSGAILAADDLFRGGIAVAVM